MCKPLCIDLYCGLGGWTEGFLAEGYSVIGFDNQRHQYGDSKYPGQLVIQDVLTLHGSQFKNAAVIVASPPCQNYSYLAMPWSRSKDPNNSKAAKTLRLKWETEGPDNRLFDACFRIQREACEAAGRYIPLIVENVRGAQPWVGRSARNYGSFHLWGDVPALMPITLKAVKTTGRSLSKDADAKWGTHNMGPGDKMAAEISANRDDGLKRPGEHSLLTGSPGNTSKGFNNWPKDESGADIMPDGTKIGGDWFSDPKSTCRKHGSRSQARKAASAQIAKIPFVLAEHIAKVYKPVAHV